MPVTAIKRTEKVYLRLRPREAELIRAKAEAMGLTIAEALRYWIAAGMRGELPVDGLFVPPRLGALDADVSAPAELAS
jgi:hypothetical protein